MMFSNRLPRGAKKYWRFTVDTPEGGLHDIIEQFVQSEGTYLDLEIKRDFTRFLIRIMIRPTDLLWASNTVCRIESADGVLLDQDGNATGTLVAVTGTISTEAKSMGLPAGELTIWSRPFQVDSEAS